MALSCAAASAISSDKIDGSEVERGQWIFMTAPKDELEVKARRRTLGRVSMSCGELFSDCERASGDAIVGLGGMGVRAGSHWPAAYAAMKRFQSYLPSSSSATGESRPARDIGGEREEEGP